MKKILIFFSATSTFLSYAQDPVFLNTNQSLVYLNPSFAGSNGGVRDQLSYRSQWPSLTGNYVTYLNSFDAYIKPLRAGIAVSLISDNASHGTLKTTQLSVAYAQHLSFADGNLKIIPSVQVGYAMKTLDRDNLHFGDMIDSRFGIIWSNPSMLPLSTKSYFNMSGGLLVNFKKNLYVGAYVFNINQPDVGLAGVTVLRSRLSLNASYNLPLNEKTLLNFSAVYNNQTALNSLQLAANAIFLKHIITGLGYVSGDVVFINLGYRSNYFSITTGYDLTYSKLAGNTAGSWQLAMGFSLRKKVAGQVPSNFENW